MRCKEYTKYLGPYIDSELDTKTCIEIANHLESCQNCRGRFAQEQELERLFVGKLEEERMPGHVWKAVKADISAVAYQPAGTVWSRINLKWFVPTVAAAALLIGLSVFFFWAKAPEGRSLALVLQEVHERYLRDGVAVRKGVVWPEDFRQTTLAGRIPKSGKIGGHGVELLGGRPYYLEDVELAFLEYKCCGEPVSVFILRKEDLDSFPQTRDLLESGGGLVSIASGDTSLTMIDVGDAVVFGISSHELDTFLRAFERV
ncbi:MAG: zf-HC2 domain-containing protein [Candidatus Brocadiales bacterium]